MGLPLGELSEISQAGSPVRTPCLVPVLGFTAEGPLQHVLYHGCCQSSATKLVCILVSAAGHSV